MSPVPHSSIRRKLLAWYDRHKRDLPWRRRSHDPYAQWVAEIMLQQTRVETVGAYYERFLARFPDVGALARAPHSAVLKHWEGLGYYRRALHLHKAAQLLAAERRDLPRMAAGLRELPGIGEYTSAAIASIAFNEPVAAVDGNVTRVISRLFAVADDVRKPQGRRRIAELANSLLNGKGSALSQEALTPTLSPRERGLRPGDFNQAMMDLGSRICMPREPNCEACPLRGECAALHEGGARNYPVSGAKAAPAEVEMLAAVFVREGKVLMRRRALGGMWSGLWEPPCAELLGRSAADALEEMARKESLIVCGKARRIGVVRHQLTHRSLNFRVHECRVVLTPREKGKSGEGARRRDRRWCGAEQLERLAISTAHRKVLGLIWGFGDVVMS